MKSALYLKLKLKQDGKKYVLKATPFQAQLTQHGDSDLAQLVASLKQIEYFENKVTMKLDLM